MRRNIPISTVDIVLLGILAEGPRGAYEIQKMIEFRNLQDWVRVSAPAAYKKLLKLEADGHVEGKAQREGRMPEKTIYSITDKGRQYFRSLMSMAASEPALALFDFNAVIANLSRVSPYEARVLLESVRAGLRASKERVSAHVPLRADIPLRGRAIMDQQIRVYDALLAWLDEYEAPILAELAGNS